MASLITFGEEREHCTWERHAARRLLCRFADDDKPQASLLHLLSIANASLEPHPGCCEQTEQQLIALIESFQEFR